MPHGAQDRIPKQKRNVDGETRTSNEGCSLIHGAAGFLARTKVPG